MVKPSTELVTITKPWGRLDGEINEATRIASVSSLSVSKSMQKQGKGTEIFKEFEAKARPCSDLIGIEIFARNENAIKFWESHGFSYIGLLDQGYLEYTKQLN